MNPSNLPKIASAAFCVVLLIPLFSPASGQFQPTDCSAPLTVNVGPNYNGPVVIDTFWVDQGVAETNATSIPTDRKEIGPGEGVAVFAVVLNNKGSNTLSSVTGFLNLPSGFAPTGTSRIPQLLQAYNPASKVTSNYAIASYYGTVTPGSTFILYFDVNVLGTAKVRTYDTTMVVNYSIGIGAASTVQSCTSALLQVPLLLPGKVVIDISSGHNIVPPAQASPMTITVRNKGSANATGVVATIVNLGASKGGTGSTSGGQFVLQSAQTNVVNMGSATFDLGTIPANGSARITTEVFPSSSAGGTTQDVQLQITYQNAWGKMITELLDTGLVVSPMPPQSLTLSYLGNGSSAVIVSGNLDDLNFAVTNNSTIPASNIVVSLVPQSASVSVVGQSTWTVPQMQPGEKRLISTKVFAANSIINTPTAFTLTASYISGGQSLTNSLALGAFVVGDIKLEIYDLAAQNVGNAPAIGGSILNQGSTTGLFSTIQIVDSPLLDAVRKAQSANVTAGGPSGNASITQRPAGATFLGDLTPDSPIPFSIPMHGLSLIKDGRYVVSFKVRYADDLKNFHESIITSTVDISKTPTAARQAGGLGLQGFLLIAGIAAAAAVAVAVFMVKRSYQKKLRMLAGNELDITKMLQDPGGKEKGDMQDEKASDRQ